MKRGVTFFLTLPVSLGLGLMQSGAKEKVDALPPVVAPPGN